MNFHALEHKILKVVRENNLHSKSLLIAISGGRDSMVLLHLLFKISKAAQLSLRCVHIHHGKSESKKQVLYRNKAQKFCKVKCQRYGIEFLTNSKTSALELKSEEEMREFRQDQIKKVINQGEVLTLGHHSQDLLETRLMRLIRGVSFQGLRAMKILSNGKFRPLLNISDSEIQIYAKEFSIEYLEDPSNKSLTPLRNWVRHEWLVNLEKRLPGASKSLCKSMELFLESGLDLRHFKPLGKTFNRHSLDLIPPQLSLKLIRQLYFEHYGLQATEAQVSEVIKQLYNSKKSHRFTIGQVLWIVNAEQVATAKS